VVTLVRKEASDDYEILDHNEYEEYLEKFFELFNELKEIRKSMELPQ